MIRDITANLNMARTTKSLLFKSQNRWLDSNNSEDLYRHPIHKWRIEQILKYTRDISGRVLDIGCFTGIVSELILKQGGKQVVGMDRLEKALTEAEERGIETVNADMDSAVIDFPAESFECVVAADVINSIYDPDAIIQECWRILKADGKLIITVPNLTCISNRLLMLAGQPPWNLEVRARTGVGTLRLFTFQTLRKLLQDNGFRVLDMNSSVFVNPVIRFSFGSFPLLSRLLPARPEWKQPRIHFSRSLARMFPTMGENIIVLAEKR